MPELAEVETVRQVLLNWTKGKKIKSLECFYPLILENCSFDELQKAIVGKRINDIKRHGKHLIFYIEDYCLFSHLRMEGKYFYYTDNSYFSKHNHLVFNLDDGKHLVYNDTRKFGRFNLIKKENVNIDSPISRLGPEPFDAKEDYLFEKAKGYSGSVKEFLLDQYVMAGLGNIYADEVCFETKLFPALKANIMCKEDCKNIINSSIKVLNKAIKLGGSTIHSFTSGNGVDGRFQNELNVYGKENCLCKNCHTPLVKTVISTRSTVFCPYCQNKITGDKKPHIIGLTGLISTGKTTVMDEIAKYGYKKYDCDELVKEAYEDKNIKNALISTFGTNNKENLRDLVKNNKENLKKLESIIHPFVIEKIKSLANKDKNIVFEASQLFESKLNKICDLIITVVCEDRVRIQRLKARNPQNYRDYANLNNDLNDSYKKVKQSDYSINTTFGIESIAEQVEKMFTLFK